MQFGNWYGICKWNYHQDSNKNKHCSRLHQVWIERCGVIFRRSMYDYTFMTCSAKWKDNALVFYSSQSPPPPPKLRPSSTKRTTQYYLRTFIKYLQYFLFAKNKSSVMFDALTPFYIYIVDVNIYTKIEYISQRLLYWDTAAHKNSNDNDENAAVNVYHTTDKHCPCMHVSMISKFKAKNSPITSRIVRNVSSLRLQLK